jgi:hypothetical protein
MIKTKADAKRALSDVSPEFVFYVCNGEILKNLEELGKALKRIDDMAYEYHVNAERNDFSNWIKDILGDDKLAKDIFSKDKKTALSIIQLRIKDLKTKTK